MTTNTHSSRLDLCIIKTYSTCRKYADFISTLALKMSHIHGVIWQKNQTCCKGLDSQAYITLPTSIPHKTNCQSKHLWERKLCNWSQCRSMPINSYYSSFIGNDRYWQVFWINVWIQDYITSQFFGLSAWFGFQRTLWKVIIPTLSTCNPTLGIVQRTLQTVLLIRQISHGVNKSWWILISIDWHWTLIKRTMYI